ncbi:hypothetical protein HanXRQr2_Chr01g0025141 [Helianthus annuus]|uniref:Uncharacterized protein n=1 Tax=Helianthus annuus TaxID=4232 RepID=A0A9K3JXE1_HELAN|nr:hypothetical protein HanXRQr2_Chr01g0025141 [Helianthus annuus]
MLCCKKMYYPPVLNDYIILTYYPLCFVVRKRITPGVKYFFAFFNKKKIVLIGIHT